MNLIEAIYLLKLPDRKYLFARRRTWPPKTAIFIPQDGLLPALRVEDITALDWEVKTGDEVPYLA